ncbi:MAG: hypothetical protein E7015_01115 [Alphaproteobacteria bacterium]|nr:hypothetical protein [Alphaproteobacteria bacterium]
MKKLLLGIMASALFLTGNTDAMKSKNDSFQKEVLGDNENIIMNNICSHANSIKIILNEMLETNHISKEEKKLVKNAINGIKQINDLSSRFAEDSGTFGLTIAENQARGKGIEILNCLTTLMKNPTISKMFNERLTEKINGLKSTLSMLNTELSKTEGKTLSEKASKFRNTAILLQEELNQIATLATTEIGMSVASQQSAITAPVTTEATSLATQQIQTTSAATTPVVPSTLTSTTSTVTSTATPQSQPSVQTTQGRRGRRR